MSKCTLLLITLITLLFCDSYQVSCFKVVDGDTVYGINSDGDTLKVRLWGVDCPERGQPYGDSATLYVKKRCLGLQLIIDEKGRDRYGRTVANVFTVNGSKGNTPLNKLLLLKGLAWWSSRYAPKQRDFESAQIAAKRHKLGLWADSLSLSPKIWRSMSAVERGAHLEKYQQ